MGSGASASKYETLDLKSLSEHEKLTLGKTLQVIYLVLPQTDIAIMIFPT